MEQFRALFRDQVGGRFSTSVLNSLRFLPFADLL
jgi:hypothetical protein